MDNQEQNTTVTDNKPDVTTEVKDAAPATPVSTPVAPAFSGPQDHTDEIFKKINRITALTLIICAIGFALISILSIWQVFGDEGGEIVWRALSSLATIAFAALIINVATKLIEQRK